MSAPALSPDKGKIMSDRDDDDSVFYVYPMTALQGWVAVALIVAAILLSTLWLARMVGLACLP